MKHFPDEEWADFARDEMEPERRSIMQQHLDAGCARCAGVLRVWTDVRRLASIEGSYEPPATTLRQVRGHFGVHKRSSALRRVADAAKLLFDSARGPLPVGVRSAGATPRQLVYETARQLIKLQMEIVRERLALVGQIVDKQDAGREYQNLPVVVRNGRKTVERTFANSLGEFELEFEPAPNTRLQLGHGADSLVVPLGSECVVGHSGDAGPVERIDGPSPLRREAGRAGKKKEKR